MCAHVLVAISTDVSDAYSRTTIFTKRKGKTGKREKREREGLKPIEAKPWPKYEVILSASWPL